MIKTPEINCNIQAFIPLFLLGTYYLPWLYQLLKQEPMFLFLFNDL